MRYETIPNGDCSENALSVHVYEDEKEGPKVKRRINHHVADNWDNYYKNKITLPYKEVVGVGAKTQTVEKETREEMLEFLRSEESLMVYSNTQELIAIANLFNINIFIFTYRGDTGWWNEVCPDPEMAASAEIKFGKWAPDMYLYHSDDTHYDLLVDENSRLALGLLAGKVGFTWNSVPSNKEKSKVSEEKLLMEEVIIVDDDTMNEYQEEITLVRGKSSGQRRTNTQSDAEEVK